MYTRVVPKPGRARQSLNRSRLSNKAPSLDADDSNPKSSIKVIVRVRPENEKEKDPKHRTVVHVVDDKMLLFDPLQEPEGFYFHGKKQNGRDLLKKPNKDLKFIFDRVFDGDALNCQVFEHTTKGLVDGLLNGFNCSVFAYGATGSGKTFTMLGSKGNPGIVYMTMMELYDKIERMSDKQLDISVSYLEVYNETIRDLLTLSSGLQVREDPQKGVVISGLSTHKPKNPGDLLHMLNFGNTNRTQHPTDANAESSRSHAIFQVLVKQQDRATGLSSNVRFAKLSLIDLAGSERASVVSKCNARFREGASINKSLLALGNCINALADRKAKGHVPYRNSKLTHILKDSLGGNCCTVMISAVSPSSASYEDTYNTLKYADRAKHIQLTVKRNVLNIGTHIGNYAKCIDELQKKVAELTAKLKAYEEDDDDAVAEGKNEDVPCACTCERRQPNELTAAEPSSLHLNVEDVENIERLFAEHIQLKKRILGYESSIRHLELQMHFRKSRLAYITVLSREEERLQRSTAKVDHSVKSLEDKCKKKIEEKQIVEARLEVSNKEIDALKSNIKASYNGLLLQLTQEMFRKKELETEKAEMQAQFTHVQDIGLALEKENMIAERLLVDSLHLVRKQQAILEGHGYLTSDLTSDFENLLRQCQALKEVSWADQTPPPQLVTYQGFLQLPVSNAMTAVNATNKVDCPHSIPRISVTDGAEKEASSRQQPSTSKSLCASPRSNRNVCKSLSRLFEEKPSPPIANGEKNPPLPDRTIGEKISRTLEDSFHTPAKVGCSEPTFNSAKRPLSPRTPERTFETFKVGDLDAAAVGSPFYALSTLGSRSLARIPSHSRMDTPIPKRMCTPPSPVLKLPIYQMKSESYVAESPIVASCFHFEQSMTVQASAITALPNAASLNTSYTIEPTAATKKHDPISCDDVSSSSTAQANKYFRGGGKMNRKFTTANSTFRVLTPQNGANQNKRPVLKPSPKESRCRPVSMAQFGSGSKVQGGPKSYMSMTAAATGKLKNARRLSVAKENTAPYTLQRRSRVVCQSVGSYVDLKCKLKKSQASIR